MGEPGGGSPVSRASFRADGGEAGSGRAGAVLRYSFVSGDCSFFSSSQISFGFMSFNCFSLLR